MEAYTERLRDHLDLDALTAELLAVVDTTVEPTRVSPGLKPEVPLAGHSPAVGRRLSDGHAQVGRCLDLSGRGDVSPRRTGH